MLTFVNMIFALYMNISHPFFSKVMNGFSLKNKTAIALCKKFFPQLFYFKLAFHMSLLYKNSWMAPKMPFSHSFAITLN